jgi:Zn-dependent protease with chaperone function
MRAVVHDGLSARSRPAAIDVGIGGLTVSLDDGEVLHLPFRDLARGDSGRLDRTVICRDDVPDWRLVIHEEPAAIPWIGLIRAAGRPPRKTAIAYTAGVIALLGLLGVFWFSGGYLLDIMASLVPHRVTEPIGRTFVRSFGGGTVCTNQDGQAALNRLLLRLRPSNGYVEPIEVTVIDSDIVNAFALPGGHIVIFSGLIDQARSPDELAGVLGHEITHVQLRHPTKALIRAIGVVGLLQALSGGTPGQLAGEALVMGQSRNAERAADAGALTLLDHAGISPVGLANFFKRLMARQDKEPKTRPDQVLDTLGGFLATHPGHAERLSAIEAAAQNAGKTTPAMPDEDWDALNQICD